VADLDLDRMEAAARAVRDSSGVVLALIARLREAEDAMNVCARCGEAIDQEAEFDKRWPEGWERCTSPVHEGRTVVHSVRYHQRPEVQAEEADAATPTPSTDTP
jgi:hypothetical protein